MRTVVYQPSISVIVPTYRRPVALRQCLGHLADQNYPRDRFEVLVVDDGSGEPPLNIVAEFQSRLNVTLRAQSHAGPGAARNTGARSAMGAYLAFTDDDCAPAPDWLAGLSACWRESPEVGVGGHTVNLLLDNLRATASQVIVNLAYDFYNRSAQDAHFFASNNLALPTAGFREIGGFDESFRWSEDRDICDRWRQAGHRLVYASGAVVHHGHDLSWTGFCRQHFHYGRGAFRYHRARMRRGTGRLRDDVRFHAELPRRLVAVFAALPLRRWAGLAALLALWQIANATGYCCEKAGRRGRCPDRPLS
jgi:GT2 family glycosyltransferase